MTDVKLNIESSNGEVTLRHGDAAPIESIKPLEVSGNIQAPADYFDHVKDTLDLKTCHVEVNAENVELTLVVNPQKEFNTAKIVGRARTTPVLTKVFRVNKDQSFSKDSFTRLVKMNRHHFNTVDESYELLATLEKLSVQVEKELTDEKPGRGTMNQQIKQKVKSSIPEGLTLNVSIFEGEDKLPLYCEIDFELAGNELRFYLVSPDLREYEQRVGEELINKQVIRFKDQIPVFFV